MIWEHVAYLIITGDPVGKNYLDSLRSSNPRAYEALRKAIEEGKHGGREE